MGFSSVFAGSWQVLVDAMANRFIGWYCRNQLPQYPAALGAGPSWLCRDSHNCYATKAYAAGDGDGVATTLITCSAYLIATELPTCGKLASFVIPHNEEPMRMTTLPSGVAVPVLGQGTWNMGEDSRRRTSELAALQTGMDLGMTLIDTAEMYGDGAAERLVGEAIHGRRDQLFIVSKVLPHHAGHRGTVAACEASLNRLGTDRIDLYLLHWRGGIPLQATLAGFEELVQSGKICAWGVSNFDTDDMEELVTVKCQTPVAANQVLYNLTRRGVEFDLLPYCAAQGVPLIAYSPVEQGQLLRHPVIQEVASRHGASAAAVALAWLLRNEGVIAIPKASTADHVRQNHAGLNLMLTANDVADLNRAFPPPASQQPLQMI